MTDHELLEQFTRGSADAMCQLVRRHSAMVHAAASRELGDPGLADDVTQTVFLVLMRRAASLSGNVVLGGWLFKTTLYAVADLRKQRRRREHHEREAAIMRPPAPPEPAVAELQPILNQAISRLRTADRDAIVLRYLEGRDVADVAGHLGITENTARQRLSRALQRLRKYLSQPAAQASAAGAIAALEAGCARGNPSVNGLIEAMARGASPPPNVDILAKGVIRMIQHAKWVGGLSIGAAAGLGLCITAVVISVAGHPAIGAAPELNSPISKLPTAAATAPVSGPKDTPKGTLAAAFEAANSGDAAGLVRCFATLTDTQAATLKQVTQAFSAYNGLMRTVETRFGANARKQMDPGLLGVTQLDVDGSKEQVTGNNAVVDMGNAGPGKISMVKDGAVWKIDPAVVDSLNPQAFQAVVQALPAVQRLTDDVAAGKYATVADLQLAIASAFPWLTAAPGTRQGAQPAAPVPHDQP